MSTRLIFVTGGARSGKSEYAMKLAEKTGRRLIYLATATPGDPEMAERIEKHRQARGAGWQTIEEPLDVADAVLKMKGCGCAVVLDCMTLWLSNLMEAEGERFEEAAKEKTAALAGVLKQLGGTAVVVSNEVGMGIVPDNAVARKFRDVAGMVNRAMAEASGEAYLVVSGLPMRLKP